MRKLLFLSISILTLTPAFTQKTYTPAEIKRLEDLGRLWGMIHYFHPAMGSGKIITDSLVIRNAAALANDPSAQNFQAVVQNMLSQLGDPATRIITAEKNKKTKIIAPRRDTATVYKDTSGYWYIALPTFALSDPKIQNKPYMHPSAWNEAKGVVLDLRNENSDEEFADYEFLYSALPLLRSALLGRSTQPAVEERIVYHNGFVNQSDGTANVYFSGFRTETRGTVPPHFSAGNSTMTKPLAIVINKHTNVALLLQLNALRSAGKCLIFFDGETVDYRTGDTKTVDLTDSLSVAFRTSDFVVNNAPVAPPDLLLQSETSSAQTFMQQCFRALNNGSQQIKPQAQTASLSLSYQIPKPGAYAGTGLPSVGHRLFGLYNFWNAIHYFFPYKKLMDRLWDNVMSEALPVFIHAHSDSAYHLAVRGLVARINDTHGFINSREAPASVRESKAWWPPVELENIGGKVWVVEKGKDSTQNLSSINLWDEVVKIDNMPVKTAVEKMRSYFAFSNENIFQQDVYSQLLRGSKNTPVTFTFLQNGKEVTITLKRTSDKQIWEHAAVSFNDDHPVMKKMPGNIGYVNMGALQRNQVDSMFSTLMNTKAIIFDIRNYPQGTAWSIAPRLAKKDTVAVRFETPLVTSEHITGGEGAQQSLSYFMVRPDKTKPRYKGKVVMLCDQTTLSQAEYTIMMFQGATDVTVVGSQTAGADGNVTDVVIPGGYRASFSGTAILYPDGAQTQRKGIRIDIPTKPTVAGLKSGKDEVLDRALRFIATGK